MKAPALVYVSLGVIIVTGLVLAGLGAALIVWAPTPLGDAEYALSALAFGGCIFATIIAKKLVTMIKTWGL
jgi:hypothetical protein